MRQREGQLCGVGQRGVVVCASERGTVVCVRQREGQLCGVGQRGAVVCGSVRGTVVCVGQLCV